MKISDADAVSVYGKEVHSSSNQEACFRNNGQIGDIYASKVNLRNEPTTHQFTAKGDWTAGGELEWSFGPGGGQGKVKLKYEHHEKSGPPRK